MMLMMMMTFMIIMLMMMLMILEFMIIDYNDDNIQDSDDIYLAVVCERSLCAKWFSRLKVHCWSKAWNTKRGGIVAGKKFLQMKRI